MYYCVAHQSAPLTRVAVFSPLTVATSFNRRKQREIVKAGEKPFVWLKCATVATIIQRADVNVFAAAPSAPLLFHHHDLRGTNFTFVFCFFSEFFITLSVNTLHALKDITIIYIMQCRTTLKLQRKKEILWLSDGQCVGWLLKSEDWRMRGFSCLITYQCFLLSQCCDVRRAWSNCH